MLLMNPEPSMDSIAPIAPTVFATPTFRTLIAEQFKLQAMQLQISLQDGHAIRIPAFMRKSLTGKKTVILGAGFDKTSQIPDVTSEDYGHVIERLAEELYATDVEWLEVRTTHHIPLLTDESDKVELNVDINTTVDDVWNSLSTNTRKNIRRPLKRGFTSTVGNSAELLEQFYQIYRMSLHDIGSLPHPKSFFNQLLQQCGKYIAIFVGYMDGIPVVSSISFVSDTEVYGAWSGIHTDYKKHNVFLAMLWQMVEYCGNTGRKTYNLGRSSAGSNPHQFKLKLANRIHKIYYYRIKTVAPRPPQSAIHHTASWIIRNTPEVVMHSLSRALLARFY